MIAFSGTKGIKIPNLIFDYVSSFLNWPVVHIILGSLAKKKTVFPFNIWIKVQVLGLVYVSLAVRQVTKQYFFHVFQ